MNDKKITIDIMSNGRFVCTMRMPITLDMVEGYEGDKPVIKAEVLKRDIEARMPSLKYMKYNICF